MDRQRSYDKRGDHQPVEGTKGIPRPVNLAVPCRSRRSGSATVPATASRTGCRASRRTA